MNATDSQNHLKHKARESAQIAEDVATWLAAGNEIQVVTDRPREILGGYNSRFGGIVVKDQEEE